MDYLRRTNHISIPPLHCSLPLTFHSRYDAIRNKADSWVLSRFNPCSVDQKKLLVQSRFPVLAATTYANGEESRVVSVAKFIAWLFAFDDINDDMVNGVGSNLTAAEELFQALADALEAKASASDGVSKVVSVALDWWTEMYPYMSPALQSRFLQTFRDSLEAWKAQISCRENNTIPDVQTYILRRRNASALFVAFVLLEYSMGIELHQEILSHPLISELHDAAIDHVSWVNDLLSLKSEYSRGEHDNLPSVVCFNESHDIQISVETVCRMIKERDADCVRLFEEIRSSKLMEKPGMERYLVGLGNWMSGNLYWSYVTARYHGVDEKPKALDASLPVLLQGPNCIGPADVNLQCIELGLNGLGPADVSLNCIELGLTG